MGGVQEVSKSNIQYSIKSGETFSKIAERFNVSTQRLQQANPQIKNVNKITAGVVINVPGYSLYEVKRLDSLSVIANKHSTNAEFLRKINNLNDINTIKVGQKIYIPIIKSKSASETPLDQPLKNNNQPITPHPERRPVIFPKEGMLYAQAEDAGYFVKDIVAYATELGGTITSNYGMRKHPITGKHRMHHGIDIGAKMGGKVPSMFDGTVINVKDNGKSGYGVLVEVESVLEDGQTIISRYAHLKKESLDLISVGKTLKAGESIGLVGSTGASTNAHLHFEIRKNKESVNPSVFVASNQRIIEASFSNPYLIASN